MSFVRFCFTHLFRCHVSHIHLSSFLYLSHLFLSRLISLSGSLCILFQSCTYSSLFERCPCVTLWPRAFFYPWPVADPNVGVRGHRLAKRNCARVRQ